MTKDLTLNHEKTNKFNIQQLEEPSLRQMYDQSSREPLSGAQPAERPVHMQGLEDP